MAAAQGQQQQQHDDNMFAFTSTPGYSNAFFGCFADPVTAIATYCCGPIVVGCTAGKLFKPNGAFDIVACLCAGIAAYRIRRHTQQRFGINEHEDASTCAIGCCGCCAISQDVHELTSRGVISPLLGGEAKPAAGQPQMATA